MSCWCQYSDIEKIAKRYYNDIKEVTFMREETRFTCRLETKLYNTIKEHAEKNKRSIAKEIEFTLENAYRNALSIEKPPKK
jgi:hypothetical protein